MSVSRRYRYEEWKDPRVQNKDQMADICNKIFLEEINDLTHLNNHHRNRRMDPATVGLAIDIVSKLVDVTIGIRKNQKLSEIQSDLKLIKSNQVTQIFNLLQ